jgi:hypothetical protein
MEFRVAKGRWQLILAVAGDELRRRNPVCKGHGDLIVIFFVSEGPLCNRSVVQLSFVLYQDVPVCVPVFVRYLLV